LRDHQNLGPARNAWPPSCAPRADDGQDPAHDRLPALSRTDAGHAATEIQLKKLEASGPPMARRTAKLVLGLVGGNADGMTFLQELIP